MFGIFKFHAFYAILWTEKILNTFIFGMFKFHVVPSCGRNKYFIYLYNKDFQLSALPIFFKNQNDFDFWATYDLLNNIDLESEIILPMHLRSGPTFYIPVLLIKRLNLFDFRCASHTLNLIASTDIDLSKFDNKQLPKIVWSNKRFDPKQIVYSFLYCEHCFYRYVVAMFKIFFKNIVQNMF